MEIKNSGQEPNLNTTGLGQRPEGSAVAAIRKFICLPGGGMRRWEPTGDWIPEDEGHTTGLHATPWGTLHFR